MIDLLGGLLGGIPPAVLLGCACLLLTVEAGLLIGLVTPGTSVLFVLGLGARYGIVPAYPALAVAVLGAVAGAQLGYLRGRARGVPRFAAVPEFQARCGPLTVCCGQWLSGARVLVPRMAAAAGLPYRRFTAASVPSATLWAGSLTGIGYVAGAPVARLLNTWLAVVAVLVLGSLLAVRLARARISGTGVRRPGRGLVPAGDALLEDVAHSGHGGEAASQRGGHRLTNGR